MEARANTLGYTMNNSMYPGQWNPPSRSQQPSYPRSSGPTSPFNAPTMANPMANNHGGHPVSTMTMGRDQIGQIGQITQYTQSPPPFYKWDAPATSAAAPSYGPIGGSVRSYSGNANGNATQAAFEDDNGRHSTAHSSSVSPAGNGMEFTANGGVVLNALGMSRQFSPVNSSDELHDVHDIHDIHDMHDHSDDSSGQAPSPPSLSMSLSSAERDNSYNNSNMLGRTDGRSRPGRRGANRDEFDGPHQFLPRPTPSYIAMQERELPHLPTNLLVQEQDNVLSQVNDRLSQCAFDFVARYQFPVPLTQDMRPVARPQDREWTEWVQLLKRLATKRRVPARVLYNGQIKQFVTILENSLEMRHAARHQSRPLKDDRNILQLISAGLQVAKILKDAPAMEFLDRLYVVTEKQIQERSSAAARYRM